MAEADALAAGVKAFAALAGIAQPIADIGKSRDDDSDMDCIATLLGNTPVSTHQLTSCHCSVSKSEHSGSRAFARPHASAAPESHLGDDRVRAQEYDRLSLLHGLHLAHELGAGRLDARAQRLKVAKGPALALWPGVGGLACQVPQQSGAPSPYVRKRASWPCVIRDKMMLGDK